jgi:hypothetical protein
MPESERDLRRYAGATNRRLILGALILVFVLGGALIVWQFGAGAGLTGVFCILTGLLPILLIIVGLWGIEWIVQRFNRD